MESTMPKDECTLPPGLLSMIIQKGTRDDTTYLLFRGSGIHIESGPDFVLRNQLPARGSHSHSDV